MKRHYKKNRKSHKLSEAHKKKISVALKGKHVSPTTEFAKGHKTGMTGKKHSLKTRNKMSLYVANTRWNYKGGITTLNKRIYDSYKYRHDNGVQIYLQEMVLLVKNVAKKESILKHITLRNFLK